MGHPLWVTLYFPRVLFMGHPVLSDIIMDPWVITPQERVRHQEQFNATNPENG